MSYRSLVLVTVALCFTGISRSGETKPALPKFEGSSYLFVWAGDAARQSTDFLAVIDANSSSSSYGRIVRTVPVDATGIMPHHTEYEFPPGQYADRERLGGRENIYFRFEPAIEAATCWAIPGSRRVQLLA
jgi:hypothetical protein